jgi:hypothetical protein
MNPFKLFSAIAVLSVLAAGIVGWLLTGTPVRDELGTVPVAATEPPPPTPPAPEKAPAQPAAAPLNKPAPPVELPGLKDGRFSLASYRGKSPVILFFFATW